MRQQGRYPDLGDNAYGAAQMQHMSGMRMEQRSGNFQGRQEMLDGQWRWERDGSKALDPRSAQMFHEGQGGDATGSLYPRPRLDSKIAMDKQGTNDPGSQSHEDDMDIGYENPSFSQTFEGLEQKFLDEILKPAKEQADAEDAENARHVEKIKAVNDNYQEQLGALRARYAARRDEFLHQESLARKNRYQKAMMDAYSGGGGMGVKNDHKGYGAAPATAYNLDNFDSFREQARFGGGVRDQDYEPRVPYPSGRLYDGQSRYY